VAAGAYSGWRPGDARHISCSDIWSTEMLASRLVRHWFPERQRILDVDRQDRTVAILAGAKAVVERGWLQGGWYVLEAPDGRRRFVGPGSLTSRSYGTVVRACLVGAVVEAATWHSPERGTAGSAIDALWRALAETEGRRLVPDRRVPSPLLRNLEVRELTRWNDHWDRTREDVVRLLDVTIRQVMAERPAPAHPGDPATDEPSREPTGVLSAG
jgi:hypothetical protein